MTQLSDPLRSLVGGRTADALHKAFGMATVGDLLRHYPRRYARRGELTDLGALAEGEQVTVSAEVSRVVNRPMRGRKGSLLEVEVTDGTGRLTLTFFNQSWRQKELRAGRVGLFAGKVGSYRGHRQLAHPDYVLFADGGEAAEAADAEEFLRDLVAVYPATSKVPSWTIGRCVRLALAQLDPAAVPDPVPAEVRDDNDLLPLGRALQLIHLPDSEAQIAAARQRLTFDEAWVVQVVLAQRRHALAGLAAKPRPAAPGGLVDALHEQLPYALTGGQREVMVQIDADLAAPAPMHRLLQGEVGSGKTVVALHAMLRVVDAGGQAVLLAPTEVLAEQHLRSITGLLGPLAESGMLGGNERGTRVDLLTGSATAARRRKVLAGAAGGETGILIGTHALLSDPVQFAELGLVVVDEQHRFGVEQRAALSEKARPGERPHVLVMTATPIPRTVAMTVFGDLTVSTLRELPAGRAPITTHVVPADRPAYVRRMWGRIAEEAANGRQAYVVCPRVDDTEPDPEAGNGWAAVHSVADTVEELAAGPLAGLRVAALHGRMTAEEKESVMSRFAGHGGEAIDVLVATTVIEVGVDVPNATVMAVLDADRFGVSQLHQLRGRVGRGGHPGLCLLHTALPAEAPGRERLHAVSQTLDGFALAEIDLLQRREGDVLGAAQSGRRSSLRLLSVARDGEVIAAARAGAGRVVSDDPRLDRHPPLAEQVAQWAADDLLGYVDKG